MSRIRTMDSKSNNIFSANVFKLNTLDRRNIITCGSDGDYRIWNGFEDDDPACIRVGDEATCIAFQVIFKFLPPKPYTLSNKCFLAERESVCRDRYACPSDLFCL
jgi:hypothetical protein